MTGYAGFRDYVGNLYSLRKEPHTGPNIPDPTGKDDPDPVVADSDLSLRVLCGCSVHGGDDKTRRNIGKN